MSANFIHPPSVALLRDWMEQLLPGTADLQSAISLPYRRVALGRALEVRERGGLQIRVTLVPAPPAWGHRALPPQQVHGPNSRPNVGGSPPPEPRSSRRKEAHSISGEGSLSLLTSAATVRRLKARH